LLAGQGFKKVYNLSGGIKAWDGGVAEGPVALNLDLVRADETPVGIIKLAYGMEQSLGDFYRAVLADTDAGELASLLEKLASIEDKHKQYLLELYGSIEPGEITPEEFEAQVSAKVMEGGFRSDEFMQRNANYLHSVGSLLDISMMLETQALDLYLRFSQKTDNPQTKEMLFKIAEEEKGHLAALGNLREKVA
jgi:sulfur-carrier protein adenylyltransferase/sulfurtransferase